MKLSINNDQQMLYESATRFASQYYSFEHRRNVISGGAGYDTAAWRQFGELGWLAINVPEAHGGLGGMHSDLIVLAQALGPAMIVEPWLSTAILATELLKRLGTSAQQSLYLPAIAEGATCWSLAWHEARSRYQVDAMDTTAETTSTGFVLSGKKLPVMHLPLADRVLVSARLQQRQGTSGQTVLFIIDPSVAGVSIQPFETIDGQRAGVLSLNQVAVSRDALLSGDAAPALTDALDLAAAVACGEAVGIMRSLIEITTEYLRTRKQFGVPIGSFQALQHRLADMYMAEQRCVSAITMLRYAFDSGTRDRRHVVSVAKAQIDKSARFIGQQAIQLHGGIGITDEYVVSHYFKRLTAIGAQFGDLNFHLDRLAQLAA